MVKLVNKILMPDIFVVRKDTTNDNMLLLNICAVGKDATNGQGIIVEHFCS